MALHPALQTALYDQEYLALAQHLLGLAPEDVVQEGKHDAETWYYEGQFPAMVVRSNGYADTPTEHQANQVPGELDVIVEFMYPSIGTMAEPDGAAYASKYTLHLHSLFRAALYSPLTTARTMDGRYRMIQILSMDEGDRDQYGNVRAFDESTQNVLWVNRCNVRAYNG